MLNIDKLNVLVEDKKILKDFSIDIKNGEIHAIMGPNGTGKSTLSKVIMGSDDYVIESGTISFNNQIINDFTVDERSRAGMFLAMQNPISIEGVTNSEFLKTAINARRESPIGLYEFIQEIDEVRMDLFMKEDMIHRSVNQGASGGERKKNEVMQIRLLKPNFIILDEIDSGLDIDSLKNVCDNLNKYLLDNPNTSVLIITHYPRIFEYIKPEFVHMMIDGKIVRTGDYGLALEIEKDGYLNAFNISENEVHE